ncbi:Maf family protein [Moraxella nasovis]|uniref:Maf family protein n=1 Tax=Moraxella nasovis TaxID=2904121 RepID=UPI001F619117|nr:Maf family protein [Moraxella nasovis]UNU73913.1 Maf family protein [Moraxella nasovis]
MQNPHIILASTSPRRQELLAAAGVDFKVLKADIDETWQAGECAKDYVVRMVQNKAQQAVQLLQDTQSSQDTHQYSWVITADTIGVLDGVVLTKPVDRADAFMMWDKMSGRTHEVWTAVCISGLQDGVITHQRHFICTTAVEFVVLTDDMKDRYWQTGEPQDKAGAYAIQGGAMAWVKAIHGSYTNVVGLPLAQTVALIDEMCHDR